MLNGIYSSRLGRFTVATAMLLIFVPLGCEKRNDGAGKSASPSPSKQSATEKRVLEVTDSRSGKVVIVKRDECFTVAGNPPTVTVLPLSPEVTGAVLSQYDTFVAKAMKDRDSNREASSLLVSLHDSMSRGNMQGVAQKILYFEFFGKALP